jgi:osmotically-inducible protein OsmY
MDGPADRKVAALRLGAPVQFRDRWQGKVAAIEVDEEWEVLNLIVRRGVGRWITNVKLPFAASQPSSEDSVRFDCTSRQAFARELPPVAAPARPLSITTPLSLPGVRLTGLLVEPALRYATDLIVHQGRMKSRVPVRDVSFEGKTLHLATHGENLRPYLTDNELESRAREALAATHALTGDERRTLSVQVKGGVVTIRGNVLTKNTTKALKQAMSQRVDAAVIRIEVVDDLELELAIGQAVERAGFHRSASVHVRSALGIVTLYGLAPAVDLVQDIVRAVSPVPGVRGVTSRIEISTSAAATFGVP